MSIKSNLKPQTNQSLSPTQAEIKRAYQIVNEDILIKAKKARVGESIRCGSLGAFRKGTYQVESEGQVYKVYKFTFRTFSALKDLSK